MSQLNFVYKKCFKVLSFALHEFIRLIFIYFLKNFFKIFNFKTKMSNYNSESDDGLHFLQQTITQEYINTNNKFKKLEDTISFYRNCLFLLFILFIIVVCIGGYYIIRLNNLNIQLLRSQVEVEVAKELFNKNIDLIIDF